MNGMTEQVARWLDRCSTCRKNKPTMPKARCQVAKALRNNSQQAIKYMEQSQHGLCKQYESKEK